jgi:hypothetical protein
MAGMTTYQISGFKMAIPEKSIFYIFLFSSFNNANNNSRLYSMKQLEDSEQRTGNDVEGSTCGLMYGTILALAQRD